MIRSLLLLVLLSAAALAARIEGTIVCCKECWAKRDLSGAANCLAQGETPQLVTGTPEKFYALKSGKWKPAQGWLALIGSRAAVEGSLRGSEIRVDSLEVLSAPEQNASIGRTAALELSDLSGVRQNLASRRGRIVVLNFWATWCQPCRKEMPDLASLVAEFAAFGVEVVAASADSSQDRAKVISFIRETRLPFPVWLGATTDDMARFGVGPALPATVLLDREGKIAWTVQGVFDPATLRKRIEALLAVPVARAVPPSRADRSLVPS